MPPVPIGNLIQLMRGYILRSITFIPLQEAIFEDFDGKVVFAPDNLGGSGFDFKVKVKSINTANSKRDGIQRSEEFLRCQKISGNDL